MTTAHPASHRLAYDDAESPAQMYGDCQEVGATLTTQRLRRLASTAVKAVVNPLFRDPAVSHAAPKVEITQATADMAARISD